MSRQPRITTIIPTHERPLLLKRAVLSVLHQSYRHVIVQILDNASGEDTELVARELACLDPRVHYHRHGRDIGGLNNILYGIEHVTTEYFSILPDDDLLLPGFLENCLELHERDDTRLAFASTRVVVVDELGRFSAPWSHPLEGQRLLPPQGAIPCLKAGVSLPGVVYRTSAIRSVGGPRPEWWNWTETGWHALAALDFPIEFSSKVGAVVFVHADSGSKRMNSMDFRTSWFQMLVEVRGAAMRSAVSRAWWNKQVLPTAYVRFLGSVVRLCNPHGAKRYTTLGKLAVASGLNALGVSGTITLARIARLFGVGRIVNRTLDWMLSLRQTVSRVSGRDPQGGEEPCLNTASRVFADLNREAGLG